MNRVHTAHTADLDPFTRRAARALLVEACAGGFTAHHWEHALGGIHALLWEDGELIGHAALVQRRLLHGGRALRVGYVEALAVRADRRRRGHGAALLGALERLIRGGYQLGALSAAEGTARFCAHRGWRQWRGPTFALTPLGIARTQADDGGIYVYPVPAGGPAHLDTSAELVCDWRDGEVW